MMSVGKKGVGHFHNTFYYSSTKKKNDKNVVKMVKMVYKILSWVFFGIFIFFFPFFPSRLLIN